MRYTIYIKIFFIIATFVTLNSIIADAAEKQTSCQFEHPDHMRHRVAITQGLSDLEYPLSYDGYTYWLEKYNNNDEKRFMACERDFTRTEKFLSLNKKLQLYLIGNYENSISGVNIEGGDYRNGDFLTLSSCQAHACVSNTHADIFDKDGNMVAIILYQYPSQSEGGAAGQALADILKQKHSILYFPLEAWVFIRKEHDTLELNRFIRDAIEYFEEGSKTTILAIHDISDE